MEQLTLWESARYRVFADEFPRCVGHVLLVSKAHLLGHMDAPIEWLPEFMAAQTLVRRFLVDTFGRASFWEHGGPDKEVGHAHLHGTPVDFVLDAGWFDRGQARHVNGWPDVREHRERTGEYVYAAGPAGAYLVLDEPAVLVEVRRQFVEQVGTQTDARGGLLRLGPEAVDRTRALWGKWANVSGARARRGGRSR